MSMRMRHAVKQNFVFFGGRIISFDFSSLFMGNFKTISLHRFATQEYIITGQLPMHLGINIDLTSCHVV